MKTIEGARSCVLGVPPIGEGNFWASVDIAKVTSGHRRYQEEKKRMGVRVVLQSGRYVYTHAWYVE